MLNRSGPTEIGISRNGAGVTIAPMTHDTADVLGAEFSKIDPWVRYPLNRAGLGAHLGAIESCAPRYMIQVGGAAGGAIVLRLKWFSGPYLQFFGVLPRYQGQGIGSLALAWFEIAARAEAARNMWVAASDFNAGAIRLYERHGFSRVTVIDSLVADGLNEVLMRKKL